MRRSPSNGLPFAWIGRPGRARRRAYVRRVVTPLVGLAVLVAGGAAVTTVERARATADAWGTIRRVPVATVRLDPGRTVGPDDVEVRDLPEALVPAGTVDDPTGRRVTAVVLEGEALVADRLGPPGTDGPAADLGPSERAVAVPLDVPMPPLDVGDAVTVGLPQDPAGAWAGVGIDDVAGRVVAADDTAVVLAVPAAEATRIALAARDGRLAVVARAPGAD